MAGILTQVADVGRTDLIDLQGIVQQQPHHGRGATRLDTSAGIGGGDQGTSLAPIQAPP